MKLLSCFFAFECVSADFRLKLKLCTENGEVQPNAHGEPEELKITYKGTTTPVIAAYGQKGASGLLQSKWIEESDNIDFLRDTDLEFTLTYMNTNVVCFEEIKFKDRNNNEIDIMPYLSFAAEPDWTSDAKKVFLLASNCDPAWLYDGKNVRPIAQGTAFRQTCRDTIQIKVNAAIDECADSSLNICDENAVCKDTAAGYDCECTNGFLGTGFMRDFEPKAGCTSSGPQTSKELCSLINLTINQFKALSCNDGDAVKMSVTMPKSLSPDNDLSELADWSDDGNGNYVASWNSWTNSEITEETRNDAEGNNYQVLVLTKESDAGCTEATIDGVTVCIKTGHDLSFKCEYSLADQTLDQQVFTVSGSDKEATAGNTGKLTYKLTVDNNAVEIGSTVTATISPVTEGLVDATIVKCSVKHKTNSESVDIITTNLKPTCELGAAIATGQGKEKLSFSWDAFKWTTTELNNVDVVEDQQVECTIQLAKTAVVKAVQSC